MTSLPASELIATGLRDLRQRRQIISANAAIFSSLVLEMFKKPAESMTVSSDLRDARVPQATDRLSPKRTG